MQRSLALALVFCSVSGFAAAASPVDANQAAKMEDVLFTFKITWHYRYPG
jgi:uncharacterized protein YijF (DUF1287 family)